MQINLFSWFMVFLPQTTQRQRKTFFFYILCLSDTHKQIRVSSPHSISRNHHEYTTSLQLQKGNSFPPKYPNLIDT
jgi:hypothetical protein